MKRNTHNSTISINQSTPEVSYKDAVTSTESNPSLDAESTAAGSIERLGALSVRSIVNTLKSYILSSEDEADLRYTPKEIEYLASDREPMFVIVDSSRVSNPRSRELLIDRYHKKDQILKTQFNKISMPVDMPSTSRDHRNDFIVAAPLLMESESSDEMQMIDINLQCENELLIGCSDSECDNDSIVLSYLKNKDAFLDLEDWSEDSRSSEYYIDSGSSLDSRTPIARHGIPLAEIISAERPSSRFTNTLPIEQFDGFTEAIEFLHQDHEFLIAAELGDDNLVRILIENEQTNIHIVDHLGRNALHFAVHSENRKLTERLLKAGVNPNVQDNLGMTPLTLCLMRSPTYLMANLLLDHGALLTPRLSPVEPGLFIQFVMMCIPTLEEERILRLLVVEAGALVDDPEAPGGRQALHFAAMSNNIRLINILVDLGADLFNVNHRNETPKQVARNFRSKEAYSILQNYEDLYCLIETKSITNELYNRTDSLETVVSA